MLGRRPCKGTQALHSTYHARHEYVHSAIPQFACPRSQGCLVLANLLVQPNCTVSAACTILRNILPVTPTLLMCMHDLYSSQDFYEDVFEELAQFGELENVNVCDNLADHMVGNVYVKFREEESAAKALAAFQGRYYNGRPIICEFSPVTDFRESTCRQYEEETCKR
eukprot:scaffold195776_cov20-Tisochrysis_lutea.AAC.2